MSEERNKYVARQVDALIDKDAIQCVMCGKAFYVRPQDDVPPICGNADCKNSYFSQLKAARAPGYARGCRICGRKFLGHAANATICSHECKNEAKRQSYQRTQRRKTPGWRLPDA